MDRAGYWLTRWIDNRCGSTPAPGSGNDRFARNGPIAGHARTLVVPFDSVRAAEDTIAEIVRLERTMERNAITGEGFKTLWSASARMR